MSFRRREFSKETKRLAFERSGGVCECHLVPWLFPDPCGCALGDGNTFYEHIDPTRISDRNDLDNCAVLTKTCWRIKTAQHDLRVIARVRKREDRAHGIRPDSSLPGARRDPFKIKLAGRQVVSRLTGRPWKG